MSAQTNKQAYKNPNEKPHPAHLPLQSYCRTDMASELYRAMGQIDDVISSEEQTSDTMLHDSGIGYREHHYGNILSEMLCVSNEEASHRLGKSIGVYYTVHTGELRYLSQADYEDCLRAVREAILAAIVSHLPDFRMPDSNPYGQGAQLQTNIDAPGIAAEDRLSVSPEWDQGAHLYNVPPAFFHKEEKKPSHTREMVQGTTPIPSGEEKPELKTDPTLSCVTDIPPAPIPENPKPFCAYSVMVVGLGNPELTPDAFGPDCVRQLHATRHLLDADEELRSQIFASDVHRLSAFNPMVLGQTGIETLELVRGAVRAAKPDLVILLDALAASETESLVSTVQIATTGIHPGGGVGNKRQPLVRETLGVPVITVGVPTVIGASTLVYRALEQAGILDREDENASSVTRMNKSSVIRMNKSSVIRMILEKTDIGCVTPKDIDAGVRAFSNLTARAINELMLGYETAAEWSVRY